jgi:hypothetical protein
MCAGLKPSTGSFSKTEMNTNLSKKILVLAIFLLTTLVALPSIRATAQGAESTWSIPFRISNVDLYAEPAGTVSDQYGLTHVFWTESLLDGRLIIKYSRYDGEVWAVPISIYISPADQAIKTLTPIVDDDGILHLYWTEGILLKGVNYMSAPVRSALNSLEWSRAIRLNIFAEEIAVLFGPDGTRHIILTRNDLGSRGVYYTFSTNDGATWSVPTWLDPDIPTAFVPAFLSFEQDERGGLHLVWAYGTSDFSVEFNNWVRYAGLPPGESEWRTFTIDRVDPADEEVGYQLNAASPVMAVSGSQVAVIWAGGVLHYRHFRLSNDYGETWSNDVRVFGNLNGQAQDGIVVDGLGRIHYFSQIRFPVGIYHAVWDGESWTAPSIVYFIRYSGSATDLGKVEAHYTRPSILNGNKMVLTFTDEPPTPKRGLYIMTRLIEDAPEIEPIPLPESSVDTAPVPTPIETETSEIPVEGSEAVESPEPETGNDGTPASEAEATPTTSVVLPEDLPSGPQASSNTALIVGMVISFLVVVGILVARMFARR